jgi:hypothetical protein
MGPTKPPGLPSAVPSVAAPQSPVSLSAGGRRKWGVLPDGTFFLTVGVSAPSTDLYRPVVIVGPINGLAHVTGALFSGLDMTEIGATDALPSPMAGPVAANLPLVLMITGHVQCDASIPQTQVPIVEVSSEQAGTTTQVPITDVPDIDRKAGLGC